MIEAQEEVLDVCDKLYTIADAGSLAKDKLENIEVIQQSVAGQKLFVPVIGEFSSGKLTMINTILRNDVLPIAITPETSLATELHYTDGEEYAEGNTMQESFKTLMSIIQSGESKSSILSGLPGAGLGAGLSSVLTAPVAATRNEKNAFLKR